MPSVSVFGAQWGDEGKGKIIDGMARDADVVVRYQGGANAGHTVVVGDAKYVLHLIPSGILHPQKRNVIGNGLALDPIKLVKEIEGLRERGVRVGPENLFVSARAHVIFDHHRLLDKLAERWKGDGRIGTTGRGIGPCYSDKAARTGLRIADLLSADCCRERLSTVLKEKNALITKVHGADSIDLDREVERFVELGRILAPYVADTGALVRKAYAAGERILFEGAQGVMLDIDHGTYPYVTSSNTSTAGIAAGVGFPPNRIERVVGIAKAYCTRVGEGPFPSEDHGDEGDAIRKAGNEYGATTGRPRRCGWFDAVAVRYAMDLNGADSLVMTNLDVLTGFPELKVAVAYRVDGELVSEFPAAATDLNGIEVVTESRPGWTEDICAVRQWKDLPEKARTYVEWVESLVGVPIELLSVGPERDQLIPRK